MMDFSGMKELTIGGVKLRELSVGGVKIWQAGRLPAGYTEVEYIQTDGNSWFDTGVNPSVYTSGIEYYFRGQYFRHNLANNYLWGCLKDGKRSGNVAANKSNNRLALYLGGKSTIYKSTDMPAYDTDFEVYLKAVSTDTSSAVMTLNGTSALTSAETSNSDMPDDNIYLCYCSNVGSTSCPMNGRVYSFIMADVATGNKIRELVPAKHKDGTVGMFDLVSGAFFGNAGTGTLTAGGAV